MPSIISIIIKTGSKKSNVKEVSLKLLELVRDIHRSVKWNITQPSNRKFSICNNTEGHGGHYAK